MSYVNVYVKYSVLIWTIQILSWECFYEGQSNFDSPILPEKVPWFLPNLEEGSPDFAKAKSDFQHYW